MRKEIVSGNITLEYDESGRLISKKKPGSYLKSWSYDDQDKTVQIITKFPDGDYIMEKYNDAGYLIERYNSCSDISETFDGENGSIRYARYGSTNTERYYRDGKLVEERYSDGLVSLFEYDERGNIVYETFKNTSKDWYDYDDDGRLIHSKSICFGDVKEIWYSYDQFGNVVYEKHETDVHCLTFVRKYSVDGKILIGEFRTEEQKNTK